MIVFLIPITQNHSCFSTAFGAMFSTAPGRLKFCPPARRAADDVSPDQRS